MKNIKFTDTIGIHEEYYPKPSSRLIPDWYKDMNSYRDNLKIPQINSEWFSTIKRCMPVFDVMTSGYIITTYTDVWVKQVAVIPEEIEFHKDLDISSFPKDVIYEWASLNPISFQSIEQAPTHPLRGGHNTAYPKWINPWSIKTPPGYSTLFIPPAHRESIFTIMPGIVDTDKYTPPVNFPFVLNSADTFQGLIPAGTPIAQVIPFKRDDGKIEFGNENDIKEQSDALAKKRTKFFDGYKTFFRQTKEYK
jgi:hypothetical protein